MTQFRTVRTAPVALILAALTLVALILVALTLAGCGSQKAQQLAALDEAYKSGVFTKEEYDAKKAALTGSPAAPASSTTSTPSASATPQEGAAVPTPPASQPPASLPPEQAPAAQSPPNPAAAVKNAPPGRPEAEPAPSRGCEDVEYKAQKSGKQSRFFAVSLESARRGAFTALANLGFTVDKDTGNEIEASRRSGGDREILHFDATQQGGKKGTKVSAETKKGSAKVPAGRSAQRSWTAAVLAQIACGLR